jgi:hypothetical protein
VTDGNGVQYLQLNCHDRWQYIRIASWNGGRRIEVNFEGIPSEKWVYNETEVDLFFDYVENRLNTYKINEMETITLDELRDRSAISRMNRLLGLEETKLEKELEEKSSPPDQSIENYYNVALSGYADTPPSSENYEEII